MKILKDKLTLDAYTIKAIDQTLQKPYKVVKTLVRWIHSECRKKRSRVPKKKVEDLEQEEETSIIYQEEDQLYYEDQGVSNGLDKR